MVKYLANNSFVQIVYAKVTSNGKTELVPMKLYIDRSCEHLEAFTSSSDDRAMFAAPATNQVKKLLANRYELQQVLGQGGFGRTYLTLDRYRFNEPCVVKEFLPQHLGEYESQKSRELFEREAKILDRIDHPQIPKFLAYFEENEQLFIVQEYVKGRTYASVLRERQQHGKAFSELEIINWLKALLPVLSYLHDRQIVHRDISLDNIMLQDESNLPMLIDFGIGSSALVRTHRENSAAATSDPAQQSIVGKIGYAPHEQIWLGQSFPSSDLYALAVTAIVLLTGIDPQTLNDRPSLKGTWHLQANVGTGLVQILNRMLQDTPARRYQSASAVLADLERLNSAPQTQLSHRSTTASIPNLSTSSTAPQTQLSRRSTAVNTSLSAPPAAPQPQMPSFTGLTSRFTIQCEEQLLKYIGPIAKFIVKQTLAKQPNLAPEEFIVVLAQQIPQASQALEFRNRLLRG
jgi:serine/threonine protein kinase